MQRMYTERSNLQQDARLNQKAFSIRVLLCVWLLWVCIRTGGQWKPLTFSRDRHLFIRAWEHSMVLFNEKTKKNGATHDEAKKKKNNIFYDCLMCKSCLAECLCSFDKVWWASFFVLVYLKLVGSRMCPIKTWSLTTDWLVTFDCFICTKEFWKHNSRIYTEKINNL